ncbi:YfiR/HmsC family protein [Arcobacter aquimarinus]|uniref:diguanylate cyclase n=1 Tax=Arcobacter aquimarinus TaxID=1315211 RepID=A0AAE7E1K8_9BACT|nr:YfiR/HmsC family protein [Arcobacter aquimarinus]QKE26229.1 diguanylate cyclase (DUF4154 domain) [Arcobacter aquimarinus]RXI35772.1 hypothetical protein CP986_05170 [Arcobacter aquimarinus]
MKLFIYIISIFLLFTNLHSKDMKEEQIKVVYTYNFMKNITWQNETKIDKYRLLVVSKNKTLENMFLMLAARKQLKNKNLEVLIYDEKEEYKNIHAIYIDENFLEIYEKLFFKYEKENTLFISDNFKDKKQVMINLLKEETKVTFEINKANILNRSLEISSNLILLGGTEIDVAKLYKSSQDALKEQKETINSLNQKIENKNLELINKVKAINEQKSIINTQTKNIKNYEQKLSTQEELLQKQTKLLEEQKIQLEEIYKNIEFQKEKLSNAVLDVNEKEKIVESLINLQKEKQQEFEETKKDLEFLNLQIQEQKKNLLLKENVISNQKNIITIMGLLSMIIIILGLNGIRQNRLLKSLSQIDTLSGLYNRRFMNQRIEEEISKYKRYETPFSILLVDVDFFKKINDNYGHDKGDLVIKKISTLMQQNTRDTDINARWGGEEFLILVPNSNLEGALTLANNLKQIIEKTNFETKEKITVSIGVSTFNENLNQEELLKLADNALYKAKNNGRNKVEFA